MYYKVNEVQDKHRLFWLPAESEGYWTKSWVINLKPGVHMIMIVY